MRKIFNKNRGEEHNFWMSYTDLMSGFLIIFIITNVIAHHRYGVTKTQLEELKEIQESVKNIDSTYFSYDLNYKRYTLKNITVSFRTESADMLDISQEDRNKLLQAGQSILSFVDAAIAKNPDTKYLLIIEGQSSKDDYHIDEYKNNDVLSYRRALALKEYWLNNNIIFEDHKCEIVVSGSGQSGSFREQPDDSSNKKNQRFVIHILPKIGDVK
jgi:flagellar motor protein MotB